MRKKCITFLIFAIIILIAVSVAAAFTEDQTGNTEYLRIHIRADSNDSTAQAVKYKVKDEVVKYLTPYLCECNSKKDAETLLNGKLSEIESVADGVLTGEGFTYRSTAKIKNESFPTRVYKDLTLNAGYYDALIIELGSGKGDNWWCVVYPPLCFTEGSAGYRYKSKIAEIIRNFYKEKSYEEKH